MNNLFRKKRLFNYIILLLTFLTMPAVASDCKLKDKRICDYQVEIKKFADGPNVSFSENTSSHPSIAVENEWVIGADDIIHLGITQNFDDLQLKFLLAHEYAHTIHRHGRKILEEIALPEDRTLSDLELFKKYKEKYSFKSDLSQAFNHSQEYEADAFALHFLESNKLNSLEAIKGLLKSGLSNSSHPSRRQRIEKAKQVIENFRKEEESKIVQNEFGPKKGII